MDDIATRKEIIATARLFNATGLSTGTSGNLSVRVDQGFLITPAGIAYDDLLPDSLIICDPQGQVIEGDLKPSSEWPSHRAIYQARPDINAVVHVHSPYATSIACTRQDIPAFHYMVSMAGGDSIRCADYATFGSEELSNHVISALTDRKACLLANHGMIALGETIDAAFRLAQEVENLAHQYWIAKQIGEPVVLDEIEMKINLEKFRVYGKQ